MKTIRHSYRPEIRITIDGTDVTTDLFGERGSVRINKSLFAPHGEAQITFPDVPLGDDSAYGVWAPIMPVKIEMRRWQTGQTQLEDFVTVFRGVIRSVGRSEQIDGQGNPQRFVHVVAHDCGAFFLMEQIGNIITYQNVGKRTAGAQTYLEEYLISEDAIAGIKPVGEFIWDVATKTTEPMMKAAGWQFEKRFFVKKGYVQPLAVLSQEGAVWSFIDRYADRPWNELFVREGKEHPELVFRPTPFYDLQGNPLPDFEKDLDADLSVYKIPKADVISLHAHRDDAELVNHVWVIPAMNAAMAYGAHLTDGVITGIINEETREKYGDRLDRRITHLQGTETPASGNPEAKQEEVRLNMVEWLKERQDWLMKAGADLHSFERGTVHIKGYASYQVGNYFELARAAKDDSLTWRGYIVRTTHDFQPYNRFTCTLEYIRSNQWERRKACPNPYWVERQRGEVAIL